MDLGSYLPLLLPLLAVPLVLLAARRLHPAAATWLTAASSVVLSIGAVISLGLFTVVGLARLSIVADLGHLSASALGHADITDLPVDPIAAALLVAWLVAGTLAASRRITAIRAARDLTDPAGAGPLLIVRTDRPVAHALPGRPGTIVISTGMLAGLDPAERRALLAHERAHLSRAHHRFVAVVDVLATANPLLHPLRKVVRYTTERWADELAACAVGSRAVVARAVGKAALATKQHHTPALEPVLLAAAAGEVPRRVAALLIAPPARRLRLMLTVPAGLFALGAIGLTVASAACAVEAAGDLHHLLTLTSAS